jgi:predicted ATPase
VVGAVAGLVERLLAACPRLAVLATSREPLRLTGEVLCPLSGLPLPPPDAPPDRAREYPAVRLFTDRAADTAANSSAGAADLAAVVAICRALDGLPLAIELAAARLRSLPVSELVARLDDRFPLLSRGSRTAQPRHRTLRAVVEWSWDLLDEPERALARRLSVFAGGATLAAVERVAGLPATEAVALLAELVDKSLVEVDGGRYRMLETIRAFGAERLAEAGETEPLRRAHAAYFLELARTADPHLRRAEQLTWLSRLDAERDNLHATLRRAVAAADHGTALRLVSALSMYWWLRGLRGEAAGLAGELLAALGPQPPPGLVEEYAVCALTAALGGTGAPSTPVDGWSFESLVRLLDRPPRQPFLLYLSAVATGPPGDGPDSFDALVARGSRLLGGDPWLAGARSIGTGLVRMWRGDWEVAARELAAALAGFRELGERWGMMLALAGLAELAAWRGDHPGAVAAMDEALGLADALGSAVDVADLRRTRGAGRTLAGDPAGAEADFRAAMALARRAGAPDTAAAARLGLGELARGRGDLAEARRLCETALAECPTGWFGAEAIRSDVLVGLARIAEAEGDPVGARDWYLRALSAPVPALAAAVAGLTGLARRAGDHERAAVLLGAGTVLLRGATVAGALDLTAAAAPLRAALGDAGYERAFARGAAMSPEQARAALGASSSVDGG